MEEARIKTNTAPQICCCITLRKVNVQLNRFIFTLARIISFMSGNICFMSFYLLGCFSSCHYRLCIAIFCLLH